jgi:hypothetical protein
MARKCILCGKAYQYCPSCPKDAKKETWYALFDNENCKNISKALTDYNLHKISKDEARSALLVCDLSIQLNDHYRNEINEIIAEPKPKRNKRKPIDDFADITPALVNEPTSEVVLQENE